MPTYFYKRVEPGYDFQSPLDWSVVRSPNRVRLRNNRKEVAVGSKHNRSWQPVLHETPSENYDDIVRVHKEVEKRLFGKERQARTNLIQKQQATYRVNVERVKPHITGYSDEWNFINRQPTHIKFDTIGNENDLRDFGFAKQQGLSNEVNLRSLQVEKGVSGYDDYIANADTLLNIERRTGYPVKFIATSPNSAYFSSLDDKKFLRLSNHWSTINGKKDVGHIGANKHIWELTKHEKGGTWQLAEAKSVKKLGENAVLELGEALAL